MIFSVQILGSNSALAAHDRHPTSQVVRYHRELFLIDCGEGSQVRMSDFHVKRSRIKRIFISHLHGDHYFGLAGLLTSWHLMGRKDELHLYAPPALEDILKLQFAASNTELKYPLIFHATQDRTPELLAETDRLEIHSFPLRHRIPTTGFLFKEKPGLRRINKRAIEGLALQGPQYDALRRGEDLEADGRRYTCDELTHPPYPPRRYAFCSDTVYLPALARQLQGVDLIYHEATFLNVDVERAKETFHSTTGQAAGIARDAGADRLLIGHFSSKYVDLGPYLEESRSVFARTDLALEGVEFEIPRKEA